MLGRSHTLQLMVGMYQTITAVRPLAPLAIPANITDDPSALPLSYRQTETSDHRDRVLQRLQHVAVRASAPPSNTTPVPYAQPSSYNQEASYQTVRDRQSTLQSLIAHYEDRGYFGSVRVLVRLLERSRLQSPQLNSTRTTISRTDNNTATSHLRRSLTPPPRTDVITDPTQRSWRSYFNTANRLRDLTSNSGDTANGTGVSPTHHQPRPQTPPPTYREVEQTTILITRADSLPSYDDFVAAPHKYTT